MRATIFLCKCTTILLLIELGYELTAITVSHFFVGDKENWVTCFRMGRHSAAFTVFQ